MATCNVPGAHQCCAGEGLTRRTCEKAAANHASSADVTLNHDAWLVIAARSQMAVPWGNLGSLCGTCGFLALFTAAGGACIDA